jgi:hypothetical protein
MLSMFWVSIGSRRLRAEQIEERDDSGQQNARDFRDLRCKFEPFHGEAAA